VRLLVLGYGSIVRRRVLPAARSLAAITLISVASRRGRAPGADAGITWFDDYDEALRSSGADAVYVSGVNTVHADWVCRSLERGLHVMVDKPAFLDVESAETAVALARRVGKGLGEATVFAFHPQASVLRSLLPPADTASTRVTACSPCHPDRRMIFAIGTTAAAAVCMISAPICSGEPPGIQ
jgi:predicted dehydrogenase